MNKTAIVVILVLVVLGGGYVYRHQIKAMLMGSPTPATMQTTGTTPSTSGATQTGSIVMTKKDAKKGNYLTGTSGMTLYVFDKDTKSVSNCTGACATLWPPYSTSTAPATLPANVTTFTRADGTLQYAYNGLPLYYYAKDQQPGDVTGDGVGGVWHLATP